MIILAIDPGRTASWALLDTARPHEIALGTLAQVGSGRLLRPCPTHLAEICTSADAAVVEEVGARPQQGVSAVFTFGLCTGAILGALGALRIPVVLVAPQTWKRTARLAGMARDSAKDAARRLATELWPQHAGLLRVRANHGLAEAALMARWYVTAGPGRDVPQPGPGDSREDGREMRALQPARRLHRLRRIA